MLICFWPCILWYLGSDLELQQASPTCCCQNCSAFYLPWEALLCQCSFQCCLSPPDPCSWCGKAHCRYQDLQNTPRVEGIWKGCLDCILFAAPWRENTLCLSDSLDISLIIQTRLRAKKGSRFVLAKEKARYLIAELKIQLQKRNINMQFQIMHNDK